jgi:hypothetical protein
LSSDGDDSYSEMTLISIALLRRVHKNARVTVFIDEVTEQKLLQRAGLVLDEADRIIRVKADFPDAATRSRYIKTKMRTLLDGNYLFLDSDALVIRRIDEIFAFRKPMAAALDLNVASPFPHNPIWIQPIYEDLGWKYPIEHYFNTGVVYWADVPETHRLAELWHERWKMVLRKFDKYHDQPSFNSAVAHMGVNVHVLPTAYNAMVEAHPRLARGAKIFHFFTSKPSAISRSNTLLGHLLKTYLFTKTIDWKCVESASAKSDAWVGLTENFQIEWVRRNYRHLAMTIARRGWRSLCRRIKKLSHS